MPDLLYLWYSYCEINPLNAMNDFAWKALFFVTLSAVFPMVGYYLDWRARRRNHRRSRKPDAKV